jgi:hypothetical protein
MQFSNLSALSLSALKALATTNNAIPTGDKRSKQSWIDALELVDAEIQLENEECTEVAEFLRENPDAEGGFYGEHCSYHTVNETDTWTAELTDAEMEAIAHAADRQQLADKLTKCFQDLWHCDLFADGQFRIEQYTLESGTIGWSKIWNGKSDELSFQLKPDGTLLFFGSATKKEIAAARSVLIAHENSNDKTPANPDVSVIDYGDMTENPTQQEAGSPISNKKGAAAVFAALLCILILAVQAILYTACVIVQAAIHLKNLFGSYNPDYDLFGQLNDMVRSRKASPAKQVQQPAY